MNKVLFDSSALLAIINAAEGFGEIREALSRSCMSIVSVTEVISALANNNIPQHEINTLIAELIPEIIPFDYNTAALAGNLVTETQGFELSISIRCCIATGIILEREIYTADKTWTKIAATRKYRIKLIGIGIDE